MLPQEALADQLVSPDDEAQPVDMVEVLANVLWAGKDTMLGAEEAALAHVCCVLSMRCAVNIVGAMLVHMCYVFVTERMHACVHMRVSTECAHVYAFAVEFAQVHICACAFVCTCAPSGTSCMLRLVMLH